MAKDFIARNPRIVFLVIGLLISVVLGVGMTKAYDMVIEDKELRIVELSKKLTEREATINTLTESHKRLSQHVKTVRIVSPDGTIKEVTESDLETQTDIRQKVQEEYKEKIAEEIKKVREEISKTTRERKKLTVLAGITTDWDKYLIGAYQLWGPLSVNAGVSVDILNKPTYMLGIGWTL